MPEPVKPLTILKIALTFSVSKSEFSTLFIINFPSEFWNKKSNGYLVCFKETILLSSKHLFLCILKVSISFFFKYVS